MRCRWRRQVDDIMQMKERTVIFSDLVEFVEKEARIATHPVFGNVLDTSKTNVQTKSRPSRSGGQNRSSFALTSEAKNKSEFLTVQGTRSKSCVYCEDKISSHTLEDCISLRKKPYKERIQFMMEKRICFGCLKEGHVAKNCSIRSTCKIGGCSRRHPSVLHTSNNDFPSNVKTFLKKIKPRLLWMDQRDESSFYR